MRRPWGDRPHTRATWYEPFEESSDISAVLGWALGVEGTFINSAGDINLLPTILEVAKKNPQRPDDAAMVALSKRLGMEDLFA